MPMYVFVCPTCGTLKEELRPVDRRDDPVECLCGEAMRRDYQSELPNPVGTEKGDTFWSQSLAINPSQAAEHRRLFPNVRVRADGCVGFDSVKERERYCEKTGFVKQSGKSRVKSTRTYPRRAKVGAASEGINGQASGNGETTG